MVGDVVAAFCGVEAGGTRPPSNAGRWGHATYYNSRISTPYFSGIL